MNQYPGFCVDCGCNVKRGHGELKKRGGKYVVSCGRGVTAKPAPPPAPKPERPTGMRLADLRIVSSNAALCVRFSVDGVGSADAFEPYSVGRAVKYTRWSEWTPKLAQYSDKPVEEHRAFYESQAAQHVAACEANEALYAALKGQIRYDADHEFQFLLSVEEEAAVKQFVADAKTALLAAILDGTATINVHEVGCDYPHLQVGGIRLPDSDTDVEYALTQNLLRDFGLKVDGREECRNLAAAIRASQIKIDQANVAKAAHRVKRAAGHHVVALKRCWECGRTQILGEYDDEFRLVRMPEPVYAACVAQQKRAHERSLSMVPAGTILSSVGFDPEPETMFEFRIEESDWYCGC